MEDKWIIVLCLAGVVILTLGLFSIFDSALLHGKDQKCRYNGFDGVAEDYGILHCKGDGYPLTK